MEAVVYVLLVKSAEEHGPAAMRDQELERSLRARIDQAQQPGRVPPGRVQLFTAAGNYEEEVVGFANRYRITLLVAETAESESGGAHRGPSAMDRIRHRLRCRVELVAPKRRTTTRGNEQ
jgi:hypothetical protein